MSVEAPAPTTIPEVEDEANNIDPTDSSPDVIDSTEQSADQLNRLEDREILGRSVKVRHDITKAGHDAVDAGDKLFANLRNTIGAPRKSFREWRMNRAKNRLEHKENRASAKHDRATNKYDARKEKLETKLTAKREADQAWVDSASSARLREKRQAKADKKHHGRSEKVQGKLRRHKQAMDAKHSARTKRNDKYRQNVYDPRAEKHQELVDLHQSRLDNAQERSEKRSAKVERQRGEALRKKELAIARKELRSMLRSHENNVTRRETRHVLTDVFGEGDKAVGEDRLRDFARQAIARQRAEVAHGKARSELRSHERRYASTRRLIEQASLRSQKLYRQARYDMQESDRIEGSLADLQDELDQAQQTHGEDALETSLAAKKLDRAASFVDELRQSAEEKVAKAERYADMASTLQSQLPAIEQDIALAGSAAEIEAAHLRSATAEAEATARSLLEIDDSAPPSQNNPQHGRG